MDRQILNFTANEQVLTVDEPIRISTNKVNYIEAHFALGDNWSGYDSVRAVWFTDYQTISTVLDSQGVCRVPFEVMKRKGQVKVDLVGSISEGDVLTDRLTSYPVVAVIVDCVAPITGAETSPITPSQFEQFVANVRADADRAEAGAEAAETSAESAETFAGQAGASATEAGTYAQSAQTYAQNAQNYAVSAETAKDDAIDAKEGAESAKADAESARDQILGMRATANTLAEGSDATASYSNGLLTLGIPRGNTGAKGDKGDKGDTGATPNLSIGTVETLPPTGTSEVTITGTAENPVLNFKLVKGDTGEVTQAELDSAISDLKSDLNIGTKFALNTVSGWLNSSGNGQTAGDSTKEVTTELISVSEGDSIRFSISHPTSHAMYVAIAYYTNGTFSSIQELLLANGTSYTWNGTIPSGITEVCFVYRSYGDAEVSILYGNYSHEETNSLTNITDRVIDLLELGNISISTSGFSYSESTTRVRTKEKTGIYLDKGDVISLRGGMIFYWGCLTDDGYKASSGWVLGNNYVVPYSGYYVILIRKNPEASITVSDLTDGFAVYKKTQRVDTGSTIVTTTNMPLSLISGSSFDPVPVIIDSSAKTITFKRDVVVFPATNDTPSVAHTINPSADLTYTWQSSSSLVKIYYHIPSGTITESAWNADTDANNNKINSKTHLLLMVLRTYEHIASITCPYLFDGFFNGLDSINNDTNVKAINHRGYGVYAPGNTLPAYKLSKQFGFNYVETDIRFTSDGVPVCLHDATVDSTSDGTGNIADMTFAQARELDFGSWKSASYAGTKIPSLEEFITLCKDLALHPYIELKIGSQAQIESLVDIVEKAGMRGKVTWISFNATFLDYVKNYDSKARLGLVVGTPTTADIATAVSLKTNENEVFLDVAEITDAIVDECIDAHIPAEIWTVDNPTTIKNLNKYISGVTSNSLKASVVLYMATLY